MLAFLLAALLPFATPAEPGSGRVILVARDAVEDPALRAMLLELVGGAPPLELRLDAGTEGSDAERSAHIAPRDHVRADEYELALRVQGAGAISMHGASFLDWYETLLPTTKPTRLAEALRRAKREGVHVVAYGAAASFAAGATLLPKELLRRTPRNPRDTHPIVSVRGLGLGPPAIVDAEGWPVGDCLELARALRDTDLDFGVFLSGEVALVHEFDPQRMICAGPGAAIVVDIARARRQKRALREGRLSLLAPGDAWSFGHWGVDAAEGRELVERPARSDEAPTAAEPVVVERFDPRAVLEALARDPARPIELAIGDYRLRLEADEATEVRRGADGRLTLSAASFDLAW